MPSNNNYIITILGPTAIGKTAKTIALAKHFSSEIISADSRQFYKEMSIGTAIPSHLELNEVPHHMIHHKSIFDTYTVGDFENDVLKLLDEKWKLHSLFFMTGGSGLFIDAVLKGLDDFPEVNPQIRIELIQELNTKGIQYVLEKLKNLDPVYYQKVDHFNTRRILRALEICITSKQSYSSFLNKKEANRNFIPIKIGLIADRKVIYEQINHRVDQMIKDGLIEEANRLFPYKHLNSLQTVGYRELFSFFEGNLTLNEAIEEIKKNTRRYAKRQLTWLRKDTEVVWFNHTCTIEELIAFINSETSKKE